MTMDHTFRIYLCILWHPLFQVNESCYLAELKNQGVEEMAKEATFLATYGKVRFNCSERDTYIEYIEANKEYLSGEIRDSMER